MKEEMDGKLKITRRRFLQASAAIGAVAAVGGIEYASERGVAMGDQPDDLSYTRTTCAPNCTGGCGQEACVQDGEIKYIIQASDYEDAEHNPRGCLKGLSFSNLIYGPQRMKGPLLHKGEWGEDTFDEVSWDEALDYAASELRRIKEKYGPQSVACVVQVAGTGHVCKGAISRLATLNGFAMMGGYEMNGDLPMSAPITFGVQSEELETYCWTDARYILVFGSNIAQTRIPDAHFLTEAKENGAKLLVFDPCFTATASKADEWYSIKPSSDAAVALGFAKVIIEEKLYDADFIKKYTDLPILIREDNDKRLLAEDVAGLAAPANIPEYRQAYVAYDGRNFLVVDPESYNLPMSVKLTGSFSVELRSGKTVKVRPAFDRLAEMVKQWTPENVEKETDMPASEIPRIARELATVKPMHIMYGASNYQWYHGDLKGRALSLLCALTGNIGHLGDGLSTYAGQYKMRYKGAAWWNVPELPDKKPSAMSFAYFLNGPTKTMSMPWPKDGVKAFIYYCNNPFDQHNLANLLKEKVQNGDLELVINLDFQKTTSSKWSHVCLPGVSWYEKKELVSTPVHPYVQMMNPAIKPLYDCRHELWIIRELADRITPGDGKYFYPDLDPDDAAEEVIKLTCETGGPEMEGVTLDKLKKGPVKLHHENPGRKRIPFYEQIQKGQPFPPVSYPSPIEATAQFVKSGRIEFYKDEDMFIKLGESLPVHKPPFEETEYVLNPKARELYPFAYVTRNSIHRVHSTHSNNEMMRELQDDSPKVYLNPDDAAKKSIQKGDMVEVFNDRGRLLAEAVLDPGIKTMMCVFEEGWWARYTHGTSYNTLIYPFVNPIHEVYFVSQMWAPNTSWNECLVDYRKAGEQ